jgi:hypothetical protein
VRVKTRGNLPRHESLLLRPAAEGFSCGIAWRPHHPRGKREPSLLVLLRYAKIAGISTDVLIDDNLELSEILPENSEANRARTGKQEML